MIGTTVDGIMVVSIETQTQAAGMRWLIRTLLSRRPAVSEPVILGALVLGTIVLEMTLGIARADPGRARFIETNRCPIVERLHSIHLRGPRSTSQDRFLAVALLGAPSHYVQCIFFDDDTQMLCEAASGRYGVSGDLIDAPSSDATAALQSLGFALEDPKGNYTREIALGTPPDLNAVADLMLGALHDGYAARIGTALTFVAPEAILRVDACPEPVE